MKPPRSILDPAFRYIPSGKTDVGATIRRVQREQQRNQQERDVKVSTMPARKAASK